MEHVRTFLLNIYIPSWAHAVVITPLLCFALCPVASMVVLRRHGTGVPSSTPNRSSRCSSLRALPVSMESSSDRGVLEDSPLFECFVLHLRRHASVMRGQISGELHNQGLGVDEVMKCHVKLWQSFEVPFALGLILLTYMSSAGRLRVDPRSTAAFYACELARFVVLSCCAWIIKWPVSRSHAELRNSCPSVFDQLFDICKHSDDCCT